MPIGMWKQCKVAGCSGLTHGKYCDKHAHLEKTDKRIAQEFYNSTARDPKMQRLYESAEWRSLRAMQLEKTPLCEKCYLNGRITRAEICDHRVEIKDGGGELDADNLQSLCRACHNKKTAIERIKRNNKF